MTKRELITVVDEDRNPIGVSIAKEIWQNEQWHETVHVWLYNEEGKILLQRRAYDKILAPGTWDTAAAGHIAAGEEPITAGLRELKEELGIEKRPEDLHFLFIEKTSNDLGELGVNNEFINTYAVKWDGDPEALDLQKEEVADARWFEPNEVKNLVENPTEQDAPAHTSGYYARAVDAIQQL